MITSPNNSIVMSKAPKKQISNEQHDCPQPNLGMMLGASAGSMVLSAEVKNGNAGSSIPLFAWI